eukprot:CAMPEP_0174231078 /NCGR_PEP_ID=MMETSP0417-20130205/1699_1 /TAXON_ID=242541 /ORGANISM="Mayorella sp, Strain BSH-02190019" /LENGTH=1066 /DNA_ID=CAMNT_0015308895 /DNA_START=114 /DNA_END=3311 /DNA_ORIENTATION=+
MAVLLHGETRRLIDGSSLPRARPNTLILFDAVPSSHRQVDAQSILSAICQPLPSPCQSVLENGVLACSFRSPIARLLFLERADSITTPLWLFVVLSSGEVYVYEWNRPRLSWFLGNVISLPFPPEPGKETRSVLDAALSSTGRHRRLLQFYWWEKRSSSAHDSLWRAELKCPSASHAASQSASASACALSQATRVFPHPKSGIIGQPICRLYPAIAGVWFETSDELGYFDAVSNQLTRASAETCYVDEQLFFPVPPSSAAAASGAGRIAATPVVSDRKEDTMLRISGEKPMRSVSAQIGDQWSDDEFSDDDERDHSAPQAWVSPQQQQQEDPQQQQQQQQQQHHHHHHRSEQDPLRKQDSAAHLLPLSRSSSPLSEHAIRVASPQTGELLSLCPSGALYLIAPPQLMAGTTLTASLQCTRLTTLLGDERFTADWLARPQVCACFVHRRTFGVVHARLGTLLFDVTTGKLLCTLDTPSLDPDRVAVWQRPLPDAELGLLSASDAWRVRWVSIRRRAELLLSEHLDTPGLDSALRLCRDWSLHDWHARYALDAAIARRDTTSCHRLLSHCQNPGLVVSVLGGDPAHRGWLLQQLRNWLHEFRPQSAISSAEPQRADRSAAANQLLLSGAEQEAARLRARRAFELNTPLNVQMYERLRRFTALLESDLEHATGLRAERLAHASSLASNASSGEAAARGVLSHVESGGDAGACDGGRCGEAGSQLSAASEDPYVVSLLSSSEASSPWEAPSPLLCALAEQAPRATLVRLSAHLFVDNCGATLEALHVSTAPPPLDVDRTQVCTSLADQLLALRNTSLRGAGPELSRALAEQLFMLYYRVQPSGVLHLVLALSGDRGEPGQVHGPTRVAWAEAALHALPPALPSADSAAQRSVRVLLLCLAEMFPEAVCTLLERERVDLESWNEALALVRLILASDQRQQEVVPPMPSAHSSQRTSASLGACSAVSDTLRAELFHLLIRCAVRAPERSRGKYLSQALAFAPSSLSLHGLVRELDTQLCDAAAERRQGEYTLDGESAVESAAPEARVLVPRGHLCVQDVRAQLLQRFQRDES